MVPSTRAATKTQRESAAAPGGGRTSAGEGSSATTSADPLGHTDQTAAPHRRMLFPGRLFRVRSLGGVTRRSVRFRLTVLYSALFLVSGAALLAITFLLVRRETALVAIRLSPTGEPTRDLPAYASALKASAERQREEQLQQLLLQSGIALSIMMVVSLVLGWFVAGRVLAPLRTMTRRTQQISQHNLHERLALQGPADELKELAETIDDLLARLETAFDAQRRFVANASHELRTPLTMMRTSLDVAAGKPSLPPELRALDVKLREGLDEADRLLESFLALSRAESGGIGEQRPVSLRHLVEAAVEARTVLIRERDIEVKPIRGDAAVVGEETLLARLVENLVDNAVRHNEARGWLSAAIEGCGGIGRLTIENGGIELDEAKVRDLAQPFRRVVADRTGSRDGFGLGLSIVAAIAAAHGGKLNLHARASGGLSASVELPLAITADESEQRP
jgi:signal transduction histidine kinase